jgi:phosphohistidine phosphatase
MKSRRLLGIVATGFLGPQHHHWPLHYHHCFFAKHTIRLMSSNGTNGDGGGFTTNAEDQAEVAKLKQRLQVRSNDSKATSTASTAATTTRVPPVQVAEGTHKYVLIRATVPLSEADDERYFVTSQHGAAYHKDAAEPLIEQLEYAGYVRIDVTGGGRIRLDAAAKTMHIYGFSYGFGLADHAISRGIVLDDPRYKDFDVTTSDEGY